VAWFASWTWHWLQGRSAVAGSTVLQIARKLEGRHRKPPERSQTVGCVAPEPPRGVHLSNRLDYTLGIEDDPARLGGRNL